MAGRGVGRRMMCGFRGVVIVAHMPVNLRSTHLHVTSLGLGATLILHASLILKPPSLR
jgi:hypothetical protein